MEQQHSYIYIYIVVVDSLLEYKTKTKRTKRTHYNDIGNNERGVNGTRES
jgi:hypothetical protein